MTPDEIAAFQAKLNTDAPAQDAPPLGLGGRLEESGRRLAANPMVRFVTAAPLYGASPTLANALTQATGIDKTRDTTSFNRETPAGPEPLKLNPMAPLDLTVPASPTLAQMRGAPSASGGYGGGGGSGAGLAAAYKQSQLNQMGTYNEEKDLVERGGELHAERIAKQADLEELDAARKQRDAEVMAQHQAQVNAQHEAFLQRNQELADQIGAEKIDPSRIIGDKSLGEKISMLLSGILSGANGQGQQVLSRLDNMIDQGVKAQMANADNLKAKLGARQSVFGQMMAESGDRRVAEMQTKNLMYEAVKQKLAADSERLGMPEVQNNAAMAMNLITQSKQNPLDTQMKAAALQAYQQQAAANAAAQRQAEERAWQRGKDVAGMALERDKLQLERDKLDAENGKDGGGLGKAGQQALALDQAKAQKELDALNRSISAADPAAVAAGGTLGNVAAEHLPGWAPGVTGARKNANARNEYNALVLPSIGAAWKLRTGGVEPKNPTILEEQAKAFTINPDDSEQTVRDKQAALRRHINQSADSAGAKPAGAPSSLRFDGDPTQPETPTDAERLRAALNAAGR